MNSIAKLPNQPVSSMVRVAKALALGAFLASVPFAVDAGATETPFTHLAGAWSGSGTITLASGSKEQIRCRANYSVDGSGSNLDLTIRCASDAYKFELQSNVAHNGGSLSGNWAELTNHVGGTISGSASGNRINVTVGGALAAQLAMSTTATRQSISIQAPGTDLGNVSISLNKGAR